MFGMEPKFWHAFLSTELPWLASSINQTLTTVGFAIIVNCDKLAIFDELIFCQQKPRLPNLH